MEKKTIGGYFLAIELFGTKIKSIMAACTFVRSEANKIAFSLYTNSFAQFRTCIRKFRHVL